MIQFQSTKSIPDRADIAFLKLCSIHRKRKKTLHHYCHSKVNCTNICLFAVFLSHFCTICILKKLQHYVKILLTVSDEAFGIASAKPFCRGALENPLDGCRRCKAIAESLRQKDRGKQIHRMLCLLISFSGATDTVGDFFI